jgi:hypothetical protein
MTRKLIAIEGILSEVPNTWLALNSLYVEDNERLPITLGFEYVSPNDFIGWATDMQRDENTGEVTVDVSFRDDAPVDPDDEDLDYTFYATNVVQETVEATDEIPAHRLVTSARLRAIAIVPIAALPRRHSQDLQAP